MSDERKIVDVFAKLSVDALCSYVPASIVRFLSESAALEKENKPLKAPFRHR
jgi:hypothetical protein